MALLAELSPGARVAVVRLRSLGDCVLTTPALALLKAARPDLEIGVVVEPRFAGVFEHNPDIALLLRPDAAAVRRFRPALCLNLHGGTRSVGITLASGAAIRAGFAHHRYAWVYHARIPRAQEILGVERTVHTAEHLASAVFWLGVPQQEIPRARLFAQNSAQPGPRTAVIHPFASTTAKTWPAERFCAVAYSLQKTGFHPVFLAGPGEDVSPFDGYDVLVGAPLAEVKSVLSEASLFIGNDSGPAHMAAAFGVSSIVIFAASDPAIWGPWKTPSEVLVAHGGTARLEVSEVLTAIERLRVKA